MSVTDNIPDFSSSEESTLLAALSFFGVEHLFIRNERKSEQAHIPHAPTLLENAVYNEWQFQALGTGKRTKKGI